MKARAPRRQQGGILILYAGLLTLMLGFAALVVDLGLVYLRRAQLQNGADHIALSAAAALNNTQAGVQAAVAAAQVRVAALSRNPLTAGWNADALRFAASPDAPEAGWLGAAAAGAAPDGLMYARVDIGALGAATRTVQPILMRVLGVTEAMDIRPRAIAGRGALRILPFAICAMGPDTATRGSGATAELVTYGFRYGVTYNLLALNMTGAAAGEYFYVDPVARPGDTPEPVDYGDDVLGPHMCAGVVSYPYIGAGALNLRRPGSLTLWRQINARFDASNNTCSANGAPADTNTWSYGPGSVPWQTYTLTSASAKSAVVTVSPTAKKLMTIADLPAQTHPPADYGTRWAYGRAKNVDGSNKSWSAWTTLYPSSPAATWSAPSDSPYNTYKSAVPAMSRDNRRIVYIPLLRCPVTEGPPLTGQVAAYGKFFLTARASATELPAEFVAAIPAATEASLLNETRLFE